MKSRFHKGASSDRLLLFFAGWGMDDAPFLPMLGAFDTLVIWDYTVLSALPSLSTEERPVHLIAWSMGVWAATQTLERGTLTSATAVNGTPWPIDDARGIPEVVFSATLEGLSETGITRFRRRMCGGAAALETFMVHAPQRSTEDLRIELAALGNAIRSRPARPFDWTRAVACADDRIFSCAAQQTAFPGALVYPGTHWAPELFARFLRGEEL